MLQKHILNNGVTRYRHISEVLSGNDKYSEIEKEKNFCAIFKPYRRCLFYLQTIKGHSIDLIVLTA